MSIPDWIKYKESTHGVNSDGYPDVSNRPSRTIWTNFTNEHHKDGQHKDMTADLWQMEAYTYTGDGGASQVITLQNTDLDIKFIRIFSESMPFSWFGSEDYYDPTICTAGYIASDHITDLDTVGEFTVGGTDLNDTDIVYYYVVFGTYSP